MGYVVLHLDKSPDNEVPMTAHIARTKMPPNAIPELTYLNEELVEYPEGVADRTEAINHRLEHAGLTRKIGTNQVRIIRVMLTGTQEDMQHIVQEGRLKAWCADNLEWLRRTFGAENVVSAVLHMDEATPHIQERHVFDCENRYGEICPQQEKALEALGFELPDPTKKQGRHNNRKMTFDSACRAMLFDIAKRHGLHLEQEPEYGGRAYLEKQDFILAKQKEQLEVQEQRLEELTLKIEDVETLIDDVADIAYDKAVEVVTDTVRVETHKEDIRLIEETKTWLQSPERKAPKKERDYAISRLDGVIGKIKNAMQSALQKIQSRLLSPEVKKTSKEQIKEKVKPSILARLERNKELAKQENEARRSEHRPHKKQNMEL